MWNRESMGSASGMGANTDSCAHAPSRIALLIRVRMRAAACARSSMVVVALPTAARTAWTSDSRVAGMVPMRMKWWSVSPFARRMTRAVVAGTKPDRPTSTRDAFALMYPASFAVAGTRSSDVGASESRAKQHTYFFPASLVVLMVFSLGYEYLSSGHTNSLSRCSRTFRGAHDSASSGAMRTGCVLHAHALL